MGKITEAIKALFTRNTTNAASVSGARVPFVQQNGTPIGNDSLANLASVLGGMAYFGDSIDSDANNMLKSGIWNVGNISGLSNYPAVGILVVHSLRTSSNWVYQQLINPTTTKPIVYARIRYNSSSNWTEWVRNYDSSILNDQTILSSLASALGGFMPRYIEKGDSNNLTSTGLYFWNSAANSPTNAATTVGSFLLVLASSSAYMTVQIQIPNKLQNDNIYIRRYHPTATIELGWSSWYSIPLTAVSA